MQADVESLQEKTTTRERWWLEVKGRFSSQVGPRNRKENSESQSQRLETGSEGTPLPGNASVLKLAAVYLEGAVRFSVK